MQAMQKKYITHVSRLYHFFLQFSYEPKKITFYCLFLHLFYHITHKIWLRMHKISCCSVSKVYSNVRLLHLQLLHVQ